MTYITKFSIINFISADPVLLKMLSFPLVASRLFTLGSYLLLELFDESYLAWEIFLFNLHFFLKLDPVLCSRIRLFLHMLATQPEFTLVQY